LKSEEVAEGVVAWARAVLPALKAGYAYPLGESGALPDVIAVVQDIRTVASDPENFPFAALEQIDGLKEWPVELSIMVPQEEGAAGEAKAHREIEGFAEALIGSTLADLTLGDRVPMASPYLTASLAEPFKERGDGTRGRVMFINMVIAEPLEFS
jgi:hypothetical protein